MNIKTFDNGISVASENIENCIWVQANRVLSYLEGERVHPEATLANYQRNIIKELLEAYDKIDRLKNPISTATECKQ